MNEFKFCFPISDVEMLTVVKEELGDTVSLCEERSATGMEIVFVAIVPTIGLTVQLVDFIMNHFVRPKSTSEKPDNHEDDEKRRNRKIEISNSRISLYNYTADEAITIIKSYLESK